MFKSVQINDRLWSSIHGWGFVVEISRVDKAMNATKYPLRVEFDSGIVLAYTVEGKHCAIHKFPSLFWKSFNFPLDATRPPKRKVWLWLYITDQGEFKITTGAWPNATRAKEVLKATDVILHKIEESLKED